MTRMRLISASSSMITILRRGAFLRWAPGGLDAARGGTAPSPPDRSVERGHDVLDPGVVLEPVHRQVLAVTGVLEAAVRHLGDQREGGFDPEAAEVQPP